MRRPSIVYWLGDTLYLNITNKCSNDCYFCLRNFKDGIAGFELKLKNEPPLPEIIRELQPVISRKSWREVVFCGYGEPMERLDEVLGITEWIKKYHAGNIVRMDTNGQGYLLNPEREVVEELKEAGVDRVSISLNADNKELYNEICRPRFEDAFESILEFIERSKDEFDTEVTAVNIQEIDLSKVEDIARKMGVKFRVRRYIPPVW